jgi:hypothetical protein
VGPVTRVNINGQDHQVEVQHDGGDLAYVIEKAQKLWQDTKSDPKPGPAFGYSAQTKLHDNRSAYGPASFRHGDRPVVD